MHSAMTMGNGRVRAVVENVRPRVDDGRFPAKRQAGEPVTVTADVFCDGHDLVAAALLWGAAEGPLAPVPMRPLGEDRFQAAFTPPRPGRYRFAVEGAVDRYRTWWRDLDRRLAAGQDVAVELIVGAELAEAAALRAREAGSTDAASALEAFAAALRAYNPNAPESMADGHAALKELLADTGAAALLDRFRDPALHARSAEYFVEADRERAAFGAWYERFPRSAGSLGHGTLRDLAALVPEIARLGFDILYLPPVHPIGRTNRKGANNALEALDNDPGSPWAVGGAEGGHTAIHPDLGTLEDFRHLRRRAGENGLELALDVAFQCSPDHPWVREHPEWFAHRPDGSIRYAENPPKKYQDIYPLDFETEDWRNLWKALRDVFLYWLGEGVRVFRVDNPHTKAFGFWEWVIAEVKRVDPGAIFLAEAFTRPKVMYRLAKLGFSQSYTYFTWRNTREELETYLTELTRPPVSDFLRPNFWPNTPDILPEFLQFGGRPAFVIRLVLAATLAGSYGIYGPHYELAVAAGLPGREEYLDSEKYAVDRRDWDAPGNLKSLIGRLNRIRRANPALARTDNVTFLPCDNERVIFYRKVSADGENVLFVAVTLDPYQRQEAEIAFPLAAMGADLARPYLAHDLLSDDKFIWQGERVRLSFDPAVQPARILRLRTRLKSERDFDYYL